MAARTDLFDRPHRLCIFVECDSSGQMVQGPKLISVHDEFFVGRDKTAFEPTTGMQHEVDTRQQPHVQAVGCFICRLRVRQL